ncbi:Gfo/Idh/MocA family oxidoreductase [Saxibacter everestensis]|uniref:Gfo/Idh/MocA family oxidoreductase n=1 Tax=Saxibacter everestensis TaxID=2909229 RepID=A0ABY8QT64_9MICO|nr:Gfo/Idh/MocA family oxidoreductase [Brevibacteriaceae bacterium ZFBP1038]
MLTRVAIVGAGSVARRHAEVLAGLGNVDVVAVADPVPEAAQKLALDCDAPWFGSADEALDSVDADAVYICVPPFAHGPGEDAALSRGLPIFVEKPLAADLHTAERLAARVESAGLVTGTGYHWRCMDTMAQARDLLSEAPALMASGYWLDKRPPVPWWGRLDRSGGQVVEQLTHVLDVARVLLGEAVDVSAMGVPSETGDPGDVDEGTVATVKFTSGAVAAFTATSLLAAKHRAALHTVSRGLVLEVSEESLIVDDGKSRREQYPAEDPRITVDREFVAAVRGEREGTRAPYADVLRTHRLACAVAESAATGRRVTVQP